MASEEGLGPTRTEALPQDRSELIAYAENYAKEKLRLQAAAIKEAGVDKQLASMARELRGMKKQITDANHLKRDFVTKVEFQAFEERIETSISQTVHRIVVEDLGDGERWVQVLQSAAPLAGLAVLSPAETAVFQRRVRSWAAEETLAVDGDAKALRLDRRTKVLISALAVAAVIIIALIKR